MKIPPLAMPGILLLITAFLFPAAISSGYSSNDYISVIRNMPSSVVAGETFTVEIVIDIETGIDGLLRGFYFTDQIPEELILEPGLTLVTVNGLEVTGGIQEAGAVGEVYPGAAPYRIILETPPDFNEGNDLRGGDGLILSYDLTVPGNAVAGTVYTFPGYSWAGRKMSSPAEDVFGHEDLPVFILEVMAGTTTTTSLITTTTTTSVSPTTSTSSSSSTSIHPTTSSSSSTTTSAQLTTSSSTSTTTTPTGSSTSTTTSLVTTSIVPQEYRVTVTPDYVSIGSNQSITLDVKTKVNGREVPDCVYEWALAPASAIGSSIEGGLFRAGINLTGSEITEYVIVRDVAHNNASSSATIVVNPESMQGRISAIFPKQLLRSRFLPTFHFLFIFGDETYFDLTSVITFSEGDYITPLDQIVVQTLFGIDNLMITLVKLESGNHNGMVDLIVTTGEGEGQFSVIAEEAIAIRLFGF